jgi:hypothetical protein
LIDAVSRVPRISTITIEILIPPTAISLVEVYSQVNGDWEDEDEYGRDQSSLPADIIAKSIEKNSSIEQTCEIHNQLRDIRENIVDMATFFVDIFVIPQRCIRGKVGRSWGCE